MEFTSGLGVELKIKNEKIKNIIYIYLNTKLVYSGGKLFGRANERCAEYTRNAFALGVIKSLCIYIYVYIYIEDKSSSGRE